MERCEFCLAWPVNHSSTMTCAPWPVDGRLHQSILNISTGDFFSSAWRPFWLVRIGIPAGIGEILAPGTCNGAVRRNIDTAQALRPTARDFATHRTAPARHHGAGAAHDVRRRRG